MSHELQLITTGEWGPAEEHVPIATVIKMEEEERLRRENEEKEKKTKHNTDKQAPEKVRFLRYSPKISSGKRSCRER